MSREELKALTWPFRGEFRDSKHFFVMEKTETFPSEIDIPSPDDLNVMPSFLALKTMPSLQEVDDSKVESKVELKAFTSEKFIHSFL